MRRAAECVTNRVKKYFEMLRLVPAQQVAVQGLAFQVLLASSIGAIVVNLGGLFLLGGMGVMRETGGLGFTAVLIVVAVLLAYYARAMSKNRVLS